MTVTTPVWSLWCTAGTAERRDAWRISTGFIASGRGLHQRIPIRSPPSTVSARGRPHLSRAVALVEELRILRHIDHCAENWVAQGLLTALVAGTVKMTAGPIRDHGPARVAGEYLDLLALPPSTMAPLATRRERPFSTWGYPRLGCSPSTGDWSSPQRRRARSAVGTRDGDVMTPKLTSNRNGCPTCLPNIESDPSTRVAVDRYIVSAAHKAAERPMDRQSTICHNLELGA